MRIIGIVSSPHRNGNGATLVREALRGAQEGGAEVAEVFLPDYQVQYCRDCGACIKTGRCAVDDDYPRLRAQLCAADGIILSSPTYGPGMCARMKNLLDRLGQYAFLTSTLGGKYVAAISTASSFGAGKVAAGLAASVRDSVFRRAYVSGSLGVHLRGRHVSSLPGALRRAQRLGVKLARDVRGHRRYALQNLLGRLPIALFLRPLIRQGVVKNKSAMGGVYEELLRTGELAPSEV